MGSANLTGELSFNNYSRLYSGVFYGTSELRQELSYELKLSDNLDYSYGAIIGASFSTRDDDLISIYTNIEAGYEKVFYEDHSEEFFKGLIAADLRAKTLKRIKLDARFGISFPKVYSYYNVDSNEHIKTVVTFDNATPAFNFSIGYLPLRTAV